MRRLFPVIVIFVLFVGCASSQRAIRPQGSPRPSSGSAKAFEDNVKKLQDRLKNASSTLEKMDVLIDAL